MKRFLVTYLVPVSVMADWKKTDPAQRRDAETKMQAQWKKWMADNAKMFVDVGAGVGKTKLVNTRGTSDTKNDIMLYSVVQAESHEAAAKSFEGHPHLQIPQSSIEVMEINPLHGMEATRLRRRRGVIPGCSLPPRPARRRIDIQIVEPLIADSRVASGTMNGVH